MDRNSSGPTRLWVTDHFRQRVRERIGPEVNPFALAVHIQTGLMSGDVTYVGRINRRGKRCFRFHDFENRVFYALIDTDSQTLISVLPPGFYINPQNRGRIKLKDTDI